MALLESVPQLNQLLDQWSKDSRTPDVVIPILNK